MDNKLHNTTTADNNVFEDVWFDAFFIDESLSGSFDASGLILEAKTTQIGSSHNWYRIDPPNGEPRPGNLRHMHGYIMKRGKLAQIFAVCDDGTGHDGCHQTRIPQEFVPILQSKGFVLPKDNLIEMLGVTQDKTASCQNIIINKTINSNIQIGNIYVMRLPMRVPFPYTCVKVVDIERDDTGMPENITYEQDFVGNVSREKVSLLDFRLSSCPIKLHHMLFEDLGFDFNGQVYSRVLDYNVGKVLFVKPEGDYYNVDKEMNEIKNRVLKTKVYSLDDLQNLYKQLFNKTFTTEIGGFTHKLISISGVEEYLHRLVDHIKQNGYCLHSDVPRLFTIGLGIPMKESECNSILSYAKYLGLIRDVIIDMQYLAYELSE